MRNEKDISFMIIEQKKYLNNAHVEASCVPKSAEEGNKEGLVFCEEVRPVKAGKESEALSKANENCARNPHV